MFIEAIVILTLQRLYKDRRYNKGGKISYLDWMQIRDLMSHGENYKAAIFAMKKGYNMSEEELKTLTPEKFHELMDKLKAQQDKSDK
jgi:hypothetical protein